MPNYKAYTKSRQERRADLILLRGMKHKEKKDAKKHAQKIIWKRNRYSFTTKLYMLKYTRRVISYMSLGKTRLFIRGYPRQLRRHLRELIYGGHRVDRFARLRRYSPVELYFLNKYAHVETERAVKKRVKKKITRRGRRRFRIRVKTTAKKHLISTGKLKKVKWFLSTANAVKDARVKSRRYFKPLQLLKADRLMGPIRRGKFLRKFKKSRHRRKNRRYHRRVVARALKRRAGTLAATGAQWRSRINKYYLKRRRIFIPNLYNLRRTFKHNWSNLYGGRIGARAKRVLWPKHRIATRKLRRFRMRRYWRFVRYAKWRI